MAKPAPQKALRKAPGREHPVAPAPEVETAPPVQAVPDPPAGATSQAEPAPLAMFSVRMDPSLRRRVKQYAAGTDASLQDVTAAALAEYLERNGG